VFLFFWKQGGAFWTTIIIFFCALKLAAQVGGSVWLAQWSSDMNKIGGEKYSSTVYLWVYLGFLLGEGVFSFGGMFAFVGWGIRASSRLHKFLLMRVLRATTSFFDFTPIGRLLSRFSKDMSVIDFFLTAQTEQALFSVLNLLALIASFLSGSLWLALVIVPTLCIYFFVYVMYRRSAVEMQRLEAVRVTFSFLSAQTDVVCGS
jgi:ABC-type multidrug transport system fused ATPase/permease subunit